MNEARSKQIQQALALIEQAKDILEMALAQEQEDFDNMPEDLRNDETGQRAEDAIDALERAATCCDDVMSACQDAI
jgi:tartrate dehydratase alpha subunit/fumarate hydratase class I-like protein